MAAEDLHALIGQIERSDAFARFAAATPKRRLVHVFAQGSPGAGPAEIGYYDPASDAITVFNAAEPIAASEAQPVFRGAESEAPHEGLAALSITEITVGLADARTRIGSMVAKEHAAHPVAQEILILQQRDGAPVWAATLLTHTLRVILVQLDARDGTVRSTESRSVLDLRAAE